MIVLLVYAAEDVRSIVGFLIRANETGAAPPPWLGNVPLAGELLTENGGNIWVPPTI